MSEALTKSALAKELGWARTTLDRRLRADTKFPVKEKNRGRDGWKFDLDDVRAHLQVAPERGPGRPAKEPAAEGKRVPATMQHLGEATETQLKKRVERQMLEDKLRKSRLELMEREPTKQAIQMMLGNLGTNLNALPEKIVRKLAMPAEAALTIRAVIDEVRQHMVNDLRQVMA